MGRKLVRSGDDVERFRREFGGVLADIVCQVVLEGEDRGGSVRNSYVFVWSQKAALSDGQLKKLLDYLVQEFGAVCTGSVSLAGLLSGSANGKGDA